MSDSTLFADARRRVAISQVLGVQLLHREGKGLRGPCPICAASLARYKAGEKWAGAFQVEKDDTRWRCHSCHPNSGDVIDLEQALRGKDGQTARDAAMRLLNMDISETDRKPVDLDRTLKANAALQAFKNEQAVRLWRDATGAAGTLAEVYLRFRGFRGLVLQNALSVLRFHPAAYHSGRGKEKRYAPALIGLIMTPWGPTGGVAVTYLAKDGQGKSDLVPQKKVWGPERRVDPNGVLRYGGVWLAPPNGPGQLIVGEGIETVGSAAIMYGAPARPVATLGLKALQGLWLADDLGRVDFSDLRSNPAYPAFVWPSPPDNPWDGPIICLDMDNNEIRVKARTHTGSDFTLMKLDGRSRAAICAILSADAWLSAGCTGCAFAIPPSGMDLNDQLQASFAGLSDGRLRVAMLDRFLDEVRPVPVDLDA